MNTDEHRFRSSIRGDSFSSDFPSSMMLTITSPAEMASWSDAQRRANLRVALVPTMGALHRGHLALVAAARERAERTVMSIFVNPLQFGAQEDLSRYPRDLERDRALADEAGVDVLF